MSLEFWDEPAISKYSWLVATASALALIFFLAVMTMRAFAVAAVRQAPNSRIALALDDTFKPSDRFSGFVDDNSSASIVVIELPPEAYEQVKTLGDNPAALAAQGVTGVTKTALPGRTGEHVYLTGAQQTPLVDYAKFILIFRDKGVAAMITANVPEAALASRAITQEKIEAALASAEVRDAAETTPALFKLTYLGPFEEDVSLMGNTKGYRLRDAPAPRGEGLEPFFLVAPSLHKLPLNLLEETAAKAFKSLDQFRDAQIEATRSLRAGGLDGVEIVGEASDWKTGAAAGLYQLMLAAPNGGYFRLVGFGPREGWEATLAEFRRIADGFRPEE
ncbi:MAG: hypothetical protein NW215_02175 [Hyphomicrobiales bacterium]|nr:hypothetical protein [Hyphomicrobiales bacterium]